MTQIELGQAAKMALEGRNARAVGHLVDQMRFKHGLDYAGCLAVFQRASTPPITESEFEILCMEADTEESYG